MVLLSDFGIVGRRTTSQAQCLLPGKTGSEPRSLRAKGLRQEPVRITGAGNRGGNQMWSEQPGVVAGASYGRAIPCLRILPYRVVGFRPSSAAAPLGP